MTSIYKTAYPYYSKRKKIDQEIITKDYRLTHHEIVWIKQNHPDDPKAQHTYAIMLMVFKNLNYFPALSDVPAEIVSYIQDQFDAKHTPMVSCHSSTASRYRKKIYKYYGITPWSHSIQLDNGEKVYPVKMFAYECALKAAKVHNFPADIINAVIEQLKGEKYEFPTFDQLDRLTRSAKEHINQKIFDDTLSTLSPTQIGVLDGLLLTSKDYNRSDYNTIKAKPKSATISNFRQLLQTHDWLLSFGDVSKHLQHIIPIKLKQFAEFARSIDASDLKDFTPSKRYTLILCLLNRVQSQAKDNLAIMFCRTINSMHKKGKNKLDELREQYRSKTHELLLAFSSILDVIDDGIEQSSIHSAKEALDEHGGISLLKEDCEQAIALNSNNHLPFILKRYKSNRNTLLNLLDILNIKSTTNETQLTDAIVHILKNRRARSEYIEDGIDLSFTTDQWRKMIIKKHHGKKLFHRQYLELCVLSEVADELRSKDLYIEGSDSYADYRDELKPMDECEEILEEYCEQLGFANNGKDFVTDLQERLKQKAILIDNQYPTTVELTIDNDGVMVLHKRNSKSPPKSAIWLEEIMKSRMKQRYLIDVLCSSHFYSDWAYVFGPLSGNNPKMKNAIERYILTSFAYGTGLGPAQTALHVRSSESAKEISWVNQRHITPEMLDKAREKLINLLSKFAIIQSWGDGSSVAGDGTMHELREQNLIAEFHFRYRKKGGIAYHHVADNYVLLFSTFMPCGVWEAVEIIEGLLKNDSDIQPKTIHGDTQSQSTVVFALSYLLGFRLMPRIRNIQDIKLFRPCSTVTYKHIDKLFAEPIDWDIIEKHWKDMMQVVLSIKSGTMSSSKILRKLSNNSKKNRLYQAFQELGRVIRTLFLLEYISNVELREIITEQTNKVEAYNGLSKWCSFGGNVLVSSNDDIEMEKAVKYNDLLTNAVMLQNVSDMTNIIAELVDEGHTITKEDISYLCPYWTSHIKRFGDIVMDFNNIPKSVESSLNQSFW